MNFVLLETSFHFAIRRGVHTKRLKASLQFFFKFARVCACVRACALTVDSSRRNMTHNCRACVAVVCALISMRRYLLLPPIAQVQRLREINVGFTSVSHCCAPQCLKMCSNFCFKPFRNNNSEILDALSRASSIFNP